MKLNSMPVQEVFKLEADPEGLAEVTVLQATEFANSQRASAFSELTFQDGGGMKQNYNPRLIFLHEAYGTLSRVSGILDENDQELFKSKSENGVEMVRHAMSFDEFKKAWLRLPSVAVDEIVDCIHEINPEWDNSRKSK